MKRLLSLISSLVLFGATLTGCAVYPYPIGGTVIIGNPGNHGQHGHDDEDD